MNARNRFASLLMPALLVLGAGLGPARADDTDIYVNNAPAPGGEPLVMFSLDYRPNLGSTACTKGECAQLILEGWLPYQTSYTFFDVLRAVLKRVMAPLDGVKVGLMLNHDNRNNCANKVQANCGNGGYIGMGFGSFVAGDTNGNKKKFHDFLAAMPVPQGNLSHSYQGKELFFEFYRYLSGQGVYNGHVGFTDYSSNGATNLDVDHPAISWDTSIETADGTRYISPLLDASSCAKIFTINIMFQVSNQEDDSDNALKAAVASGGMAIGNNSTFPKVIQWLRDADLADGTKGTAPDLPGKQNVTSYFIVDPTKINTTTRGYASAGGTGVPLPLSEDPEELTKTITDIFKQILSVSTTFVAASVPVNVFNRAEVVDNVYIALFQADQDARPYWPGNVKKLKIQGLNESNPVLVDANGQPAVAADGRIRYSALTYWTKQASLPSPRLEAGEVAGADGRSVDRGAAGQNIPGFISGSVGTSNSATSRRIYFDDGATLGNLNADAVTAAALKPYLGLEAPANTDADALAILKYARGMDAYDDDDDGNTTETRSWIMADPLHSRPLPMNYGTRGGYSTTNPAIYVAVAGNDGLMHFIRNTTTGGAESGEEVWAFMPKAVMDKLPILATNAAGVKHPYLLDGSPVAFMDDTNSNGTIDSGERAYLFFGLGRGGRAYYALDVTDPENPKLLWTIDSDTPKFEQLAYTMADPRVIRVNTGSGVKPALVLTGGYDTNKDYASASGNELGTDDTVGRAIFVVDAQTGALIWRAVGGSGSNTDDTFYHEKLVDSIPATAAVLDSDGNGVHDRIVVGDSGGNVWRADLVGTDTADWKLTLLATLGRHSSSPQIKTEDRRFLHRPDLVLGVDPDGTPYDAVIIGSGDRQDPLDKGGVTENWMFMIKDRATVPGSAVDEGILPEDLADVTNTCLTPDGPCEADLSYGWRLRMTAGGEKVLATPITIGNTVFFTSYIPPGGSDLGSCGPSEGTGRIYAVSLKNAAAVRDYDATTEGLERYQTLNSKGIPAEVVSLPPSSILRPDLTIEPVGSPTRFPTYWFESEDADL
jgi:type IV pilus assembly protein PilY1